MKHYRYLKRKLRHQNQLLTCSYIARGNLCIFQIKVRHKEKENDSNTANGSRSEPLATEITVGTYVACYLQEYSDEEPQFFCLGPELPFKR